MENVPEQFDVFYRFGTALVAGLLIGLQREYAFGRESDQATHELIAGARTFALLSLLGATAALVADITTAPLAFVAVVIIVGALVAISYLLGARVGSVGLTTEVAALISVLVGALCYWDEIDVAAALAVATTVLLALKLQTQSLVRSITREDVYATLKFAVISVIVLPILPRHGFGPPPFDVLVPYEIWLMVVFISGISFLGYVLIKIVGARRGVGLTGILGGLVSSTAVTLSFSQRSQGAKTLSRAFALAIIAAWGVMFVRVMIEVAALNRPLLAIVWIPIAAATVMCLLYCGYLYLNQETPREEHDHEFTNPFELGPALTFGLLYAVILLAANAAQHYLGDTGVYLSSVASGLADVDAITLTMAQLSRDGQLELRTAARAIVLATAANTLVKGGIVLSVGAPSLRKHILPGLLLVLATAIGVVFLL